MQLPSAFARYRLRRSAWRHLRVPLYIPSEGEAVVRLLACKGPVAFVAEVERLASLGSPWAAAVQGYMLLMTREDHEANVARAIEICRAPATGGDAYAQYILSWALMFAGRRHEGLQMMKAAAVKRFPPAAVSIAKFMSAGLGVQSANSRDALGALRVAQRLGHKGVCAARSLIYRGGQLGLGGRLIGYALMPCVIAQAAAATLWWDPFSVMNFEFDLRNKSKTIFLSESG